MTEALRTIEYYFEAFRAAIERCQTAGAFVAADLEDAYDRLYRLRERYLDERPNLTKAEREALSKVFEHDVYIRGMLGMRQVGEHVTGRRELTIYRPNNGPITLDSETSAGAMFAALNVSLPDTAGNPQHVDHMGMLKEAKRRIEKAIAKAKA